MGITSVVFKALSYREHHVDCGFKQWGLFCLSAPANGGAAERSCVQQQLSLSPVTVGLMQGSPSWSSIVWHSYSHSFSLRWRKTRRDFQLISSSVFEFLMHLVAMWDQKWEESGWGRSSNSSAECIWVWPLASTVQFSPILSNTDKHPLRMAWNCKTGLNVRHIQLLCQQLVLKW